MINTAPHLPIGNTKNMYLALQMNDVEEPSGPVTHISIVSSTRVASGLSSERVP